MFLYFSSKEVYSSMTGSVEDREEEEEEDDDDDELEEEVEEVPLLEISISLLTVTEKLMQMTIPRELNPKAPEIPR